MNYTDEQLKRALAKMLPEKLIYLEGDAQELCHICRDLTNDIEHYLGVLDTELLHLCWLVEKSLCEYTGENNNEYSQQDNYAKELMKLNAIWSGSAWDWGDVCDGDLFRAASATWQQRTIALAEIKGVEI